MSVGRFLQQGAAGNAGGPVYVEDVFSTYLYKGNQSNQTITNGIDLAGEGGLVWLKGRTNTQAHGLYDTARGVNKLLQSDSSVGQSTYSGVNQFNSNGFRIGSQAEFNQSNLDYVSWTFRKQPGFFDVVTYTGNGSTQEISHNLGATPGCVMIKSTSANSWIVWHRDSYPNQQSTLRLDSTAAADNGYAAYYFGNNSATVDPTSTTLTVGSRTEVNGSSNSFVAYLFAHDAQDFGTDSDESIIKCGSYAGNGSTTGPTINLGWEPQWLLIKRTSAVENWVLYDSMRGITAKGLNDPFLLANSQIYEQEGSFLEVNPTGFQPTTSDSSINSSSNYYSYIAIRRPHKPASELDATDLFAVDNADGSSVPRWSSGFPVDMAFERGTTFSDNTRIASRFLEKRYLETTSTQAETTHANYTFDWSDGWWQSAGATNDYSWMFRRAPGFFDVVTYSGGSNPINHGLGVTPEMIWVKRRDGAAYWAIYHKDTGLSKNWDLPSNAGAFSNPTYTAVSATSFSGQTSYTNINYSGMTYVAYLFATVAGISKVGSYTGTGSNLDVDCGFTSGARFVLIKRNGTGDWYIYDSFRGIVAGNDPYLLLNTTAAEVTSTDYIDPLSSGFTITSSAPAALNTSGSTYIFLAIA